MGFQFVKDMNIEALEEEIQFVQRLPLAVPMIDGLLEELPTYKRLADDYTLKRKKCKFGLKQIEYVGRVISKDGLSMSEAKIQSVLDFPRPKTVTAPRGFLGLANYFRIFVPNHSNIVAPLHKMTTHDSKKHARAIWTPDNIQAFQNIREAISCCPLMHFINEVSPIHLYTDASDYGVGGALFQEVGEDMDPISFVSKSLTFSQLNWSTIQKEAYGLYFCCIKLDPLIRDRKFIIYTDHKNLIYMKSAPSSMVGRWFMALQEFDFEIRYVKGKDKIVADAMSRLCPNLQELVIKPASEMNGTEPVLIMSFGSPPPEWLRHSGFSFLSQVYPLG